MIGCLPIILLLTFRVIYRIRKAGEHNTEIDKAHYGEIISQDLRDNLLGNYWNPLVMVRWTVTNVIVIALRDYP
jgi:hypothetical protein